MDINIIEPALYETGVPHEQMKRLRAESPVFWHREKAGKGFWAIMRHRDVVAVSRDPATFSSWKGGSELMDLEEGSMELDGRRFMMVNMDPPQHTKFRSLVRGGFVPRMVAKLEHSIRERVGQILDQVEERGGEVDFLTDVAAQLPLEVIAEMIGVPVADRPMVFGWSDALVASSGPQDDPEIAKLKEAGEAAAMYMWAYAGDLAQHRYDNPSDDLISVLMHAEVDGQKLTAMEFAAFFMLLVVAGNETTRNVIASGTLALLQHPDQMVRLMENPALVPSAVEEMLRFVPPINQFRRTATRDLEFRGQHIKEGDKVAMFYSSANRDEDVFANPDVFDIGRTPNDHLAFGVGTHVCLGNTLARVEIRAMFAALIHRFQAFELTGPVKRLRSNFVMGITSMPMRLTPHRRAARIAI